MRANSSKQRCASMTRAACGCRVGGCSGHLTASLSCSDFPGVDHEGRQACLVLITVVMQSGALVWLSLLQEPSEFSLVL